MKKKQKEESFEPVFFKLENPIAFHEYHDGIRLSPETVWDVVKVIDLEIEATKKEMRELTKSEDISSLMPEGKCMFIWIRGRSQGRVRLAYLSTKLEILKDIRDKITTRFIG